MGNDSQYKSFFSVCFTFADIKIAGIGELGEEVLPSLEQLAGKVVRL